MDERLKELATWAGAEFIPSHQPGRGVISSNWNNSNLDIEMFAEMIVQRCAHIARMFDEPKLFGPGMIIGNQIEDHFGLDYEEDFGCPCGADGGTSCGSPYCQQLTGE